MATLQAPGTDVTIINETFFIPAQATTVPVIFGVTAEQKLLEDGLTVASGTTVGNKLRAITGVSQSRTLYGTPRFYRDVDGNALHGDSRNEYGLATLNYVLGITALAYFVRADINTDDTRTNLLTIWDRLVLQAANEIESKSAAKLNAINLAAGLTVGNLGYRTSLTKVEVTPIVQAALDSILHAFYSFRAKTVLNGLTTVDDPTPVVWTNALGYAANTFVYHSATKKFYKSSGTTLTTDIPGTAGVWVATVIPWKNTRNIFQNDRTTMPFQIYDGPAGFLGLPNAVDGFIGVLGEINGWTSGTVIAAEFTPLEIKNLVRNVSDDFVLTVEFGSSTSLGADDASRRVAIVTALQKAVLTVPELRSESITYTLVIAPGFPELVDELNGLYQENFSETAVIGDGPMNMTPEDYVTWASANSASGLVLSDRTLPAGYPSRVYGDHYYYYGCGVITNIDGSDIVVPASVIGLRAICYSDLITYPWFAPAGLPNGMVTGVSRIGYLKGELGTATTFVDAPLTQGDRNQFAAKNINAIPFVDGSGYVIMSQTTSAAVSSELSSINIDRGVKYIKRGIRRNSKPFLFKPNDQRTRDQFKAFIDAFLSELVTLRCLFDFATLCDASNNNSERVAKKELWCDVAIQPITAVEFIYVPITVKKPA